MCSFISSALIDTCLYAGNAKVFDLAPVKNAAVFGLAKGVSYRIAFNTTSLAIGFFAERLHNKEDSGIKTTMKVFGTLGSIALIPLIAEVASVSGAFFIAKHLDLNCYQNLV